MAPNRITPRGRVRRALAAAAALLLLALAGCGGNSSAPSAAVPDKVADGEVLNRVLSRELAVARAYQRLLPRLHGADLALARRFLAQEQEHVDEILRALRGLGAKATPAEEEIEGEGPRSRADVLAFLYEIESVSVDDGLRASSDLTTPWMHSLLGSIVANQAEHLVLLRRALGAGPLESVPEAFETGAAPPPERSGEN